MKKSYITPATLAVTLQAEMPMAASIEMNVDKSAENQIQSEDELLVRERILNEGEEVFEEQNTWENGLW
jgi:hypothetical protein